VRISSQDLGHITVLRLLSLLRMICSYHPIVVV